MVLATRLMQPLVHRNCRSDWHHSRSAGRLYRGVLDQAIMRLADVIMTLPTLVIILALVSFVDPSVYNASALPGWPALARLLRAQFLSVRERDFVQALRAVGRTTGGSSSRPSRLTRYDRLSSGPASVWPEPSDRGCAFGPWLWRAATHCCQ